jgi:hypothetical protein
MFGALWHFWRFYASLQWRRVVLNLQIPTCAVIAAAIAWNPYSLERAISESVVSQMVNYNFMAFGFTVAALTIVFAIPGTKFQDYMFERAEKFPERGQGPWEDALFIMVWNGVVHFIGLGTAVFTLANCFDSSSGEAEAIFAFSGHPNAEIFGLFLFFQLYAACQFLMTLLSSYFFCASYVRDSRRAWKEKRDKRAS